MLCKNCPVASPTLEDSAMPFSEQSDIPLVNQNPVQRDPSAEIHPRTESSQELLNPTEDMGREILCKEDSYSGSSSELDSELCSDSGSQDECVSELETPLDKSPIQPLKETSPKSLKDQTILDETSPREPVSKATLEDNQIPT